MQIKCSHALTHSKASRSKSAFSLSQPPPFLRSSPPLFIYTSYLNNSHCLLFSLNVLLLKPAMSYCSNQMDTWMQQVGQMADRPVWRWLPRLGLPFPSRYIIISVAESRMQRGKKKNYIQYYMNWLNKWTDAYLLSKPKCDLLRRCVKHLLCSLTGGSFSSKPERCTQNKIRLKSYKDLQLMTSQQFWVSFSFQKPLPFCRYAFFGG